MEFSRNRVAIVYAPSGQGTSGQETGTCPAFSINDEGLMMTEDLMDYILSGYKLYENKGET